MASFVGNAVVVLVSASSESQQAACTSAGKRTKTASRSSCRGNSGERSRFSQSKVYATRLRATTPAAVRNPRSPMGVVLREGEEGSAQDRERDSGIKYAVSKAKHDSFGQDKNPGGRKRPPIRTPAPR